MNKDREATPRGKHLEKTDAESYGTTDDLYQTPTPKIAGRQFDNYDPVGPDVKNQPWAPEGNGIDKSGDRLASLYRDSPSKREFDGFNYIPYKGGQFDAQEITVNPFRNDRGKES